MDDEIKKSLENIDARLARIEEKQEKVEKTVERVEKSSRSRWTWARRFAGISFMAAALGFAVTDTLHPAASVALFAFGLLVILYNSRT